MKSFALKLVELKETARHRALRLPEGIDLSSNDYLGLSRHPALRRAAVEALEKGLEIGATGSRLLRGHRDAHADLESFAAAYYGVPKVLFFANGFMANYALITTLIGRNDIVVFDELCHASMRDGIHAAGCRSLKISHNDLNAYEDALKKPRAQDAHLWILVESVYSMDGDLAPLKALLALAEKYDAIVIVDEAHGTGVAGPTGRGLGEGLPHERLITLHTCGKALGVAGALVCASEEIVEYLINKARPFIYSTAPMPLQAVLVKRALEIVRDEPERRVRLNEIIGLARQCFPTLEIHSQIVPLRVGSEERALALSSYLQNRSFDIRAIRHPTVPKGEARLRLSLHVGLTDEVVKSFAAALLPVWEK